MSKKLFEPDDEKKEQKVKDLKTKDIKKLEDLILPDSDTPTCFTNTTHAQKDEMHSDLYDSILQSLGLEEDKLKDFRVSIYYGEKHNFGCICFFEFKKEEDLERQLENFFEYTHRFNIVEYKKAFSLIKNNYAVILETSKESLKDGVEELYKKTKNRFDMKEIKRKATYSTE